jgi:hypothetical protein
MDNTYSLETINTLISINRKCVEKQKKIINSSFCELGNRNACVSISVENFSTSISWLFSFHVLFSVLKSIRIVASFDNVAVMR